MGVPQYRQNHSSIVQYVKNEVMNFIFELDEKKKKLGCKSLVFVTVDIKSMLAACGFFSANIGGK